ncbi:hypothetical protein I302_103330 [Kwoniella bestiolae CBS 10118]|uniref:Uncharacterized protein n=1 Tax=Kwoniella bestiolae CBS 10118 TaxID=1296100 RepID=A0AAJ8K5L0_9TREE
MNRIPVVLTIDEIEYLLDQLPPPDKDEDKMVSKLRETLKRSLEEVRKGAEQVSFALLCCASGASLPQLV